MTIEIRKASTLDTNKMIALATALMEEIGGIPGSRSQVSRLFAEIERSDADQVLVAKEDGVLVGMLLVHYRRAMSHGNWIAEVDDMYVEPSHRHRGLATMLLDEAAKLAKARGAAALKAGIGTANKDALEFYERHGFVRQGFVVSRSLEQ